jgi:hypothetical protein
MGDTTDLRMLADRLTGDIMVTESRGEYVLRAVELESFDQAGAVRRQAAELASAMSASARLALGTSTPIGLGAVYRVRDDGKRDITIFPEPAVVRMRALPVTLTVTRADGPSEVHRPADLVARWIPHPPFRARGPGSKAMLADRPTAWSGVSEGCGCVM